jgi:hypothetical protein
MIFVFVFDEATGSNQKGKEFGSNNGPPDSVNSPDFRKDNNSCYLENNGSEEGHNGGNKAVIERGEETGSEDVEPDKDEGKSAYKNRRQKNYYIRP